jgi:protein-disulfide isomerase-like protein with CxxC motif
MTDVMSDLIRAAAGRGGPPAAAPVDDGDRARREIAADIGIPAELAERLRGDTDRELVEDARALARALGIEPAQSLAVSLDGGVRQVVPEQDPYAEMDRLIRERTNAPR